MARSSGRAGATEEAARHPASRPARRAFVLGAASSALLAWACDPRPPAERADALRIISLAPSITETLFAMGADESVVGVSDYCDYPEGAQRRPRAGTALTPNIEAIASLRPTLILSQRAQGSRVEALRAIARTELLPWLTLSEVLSSTRALGRLTSREAAAEALAATLEERLSQRPPEGAPRVLMVLGSTPGKMSEIWFLRRNALHGTVLEAAGGRNAVAEDISRTPNLPLERVIALDPEVVLILVGVDRIEDSVEARYIADWKALPIAAAKRGAIRVIHGPEVKSTGPRILGLLDKVTAAIHDATAHPR
ncbi:helical backbone metal receptor [Sorangium sp. So ce1036]|uniref:ABC transporter substrate-binding protein n=1 Tax=Sorangium TaxID=39643 RepID=UPI001013255F|nr:helical backbone metal receptor [Sorangium cellulosum]